MTSGIEILADLIDGRLHAAVVYKGKLENLYVDPLNMAGCWASIYMGKVTKIDTRLNSAMVDLGGGMTGILSAKHVGQPVKSTLKEPPGISQLLRPGDMVMVQVKSEAKKEAAGKLHKLPRLTTRIYMFGDALVYSPLVKQMVAPANVVCDDIKAAIAKMEGTQGGWIIRRSAAGTKTRDMLFEARTLIDQWKEVMAARSADENTPRLLRAGPNALERAVCEYSAIDADHVHVGTKQLLDQMMAWSAAHYPQLAESKRLRLYRPANGNDRLFEMHDVYSALAALHEEYVPLPCGGSIVIEQTHAVLVVDVNLGSADNVEQVNMEAAAEIIRQTRLRNLSGALLLDFINMQKRSARADLITALEKGFAEDTGSAQVHGFTRLGIVEVTRKRRTSTVAESWRD